MRVSITDPGMTLMHRDQTGWGLVTTCGVKTRPSEQTVVHVEADLLLGPDRSLEMDSETDDQSYSPTEVYALTWHGVLVIHHIFELCYAMLSS